MNAAALVRGAVFVLAGLPVLLFAGLGALSLSRRRAQEPLVGAVTRLALVILVAVAGLGLAAHELGGRRPQVIRIGRWIAMGPHALDVVFLADRPSLGFALLTTIACGVVAAFSHRYMHREPGYTRYFVLFAAFLAGMLMVTLAGSVTVLITGWEMLGLSSALLVGFFHERRAPVTNALRVFTVYRIGDAAMLSAAVLLHHWAGSDSLSLLFSAVEGEPELAPSRVTAIVVLLLVAVAAKSALLPFSGWLPRAMEGPTPSTAIFYGSLSVHAGCYLLLRAEPLLAQSLTARCLALSAGATTALYATVTARVQTDVKSALSLAALTQVGLIVVEIALGWTTVAMVHIIGHASFRLLSFLAAPNALHDLHELESAMGGPIEARRARGSVPAVVYRLALERGLLDALLDRLVVVPFHRAAAFCDRLDRRLSGQAPEDPHG